MSRKENAPAITPTPIRRPPSEAQLRANRLNAQKSTGPRTEEGKQRTSLNATRHGLTAQVLTLTAEELKALQALIVDFEKQYQPATTQEKHLVHMLGQLQFRLHRIMATEHNLFAIGLTENSEFWDVDHPEAQTYSFLPKRCAVRKIRCSRIHLRTATDAPIREDAQNVARSPGGA